MDKKTKHKITWYTFLWLFGGLPLMLVYYFGGKVWKNKKKDEKGQSETPQ